MRDLEPRKMYAPAGRGLPQPKGEGRRLLGTGTVRIARVVRNARWRKVRGFEGSTVRRFEVRRFEFEVRVRGSSSRFAGSTVEPRTFEPGTVEPSNVRTFERNAV